MKPKKYDYENLYQKWYKFIWPNLCLYVPIVGGLVGAIISVTNSAGFFAFIGILAGGIIAGFLSRFLVAVSISQKVVATDALLALSNHKNAQEDTDDLPDL